MCMFLTIVCTTGHTSAIYSIYFVVQYNSECREVKILKIFSPPPYFFARLQPEAEEFLNKILGLIGKSVQVDGPLVFVVAHRWVRPGSMGRYSGPVPRCDAWQDSRRCWHSSKNAQLQVLWTARLWHVSSVIWMVHLVTKLWIWGSWI